MKTRQKTKVQRVCELIKDKFDIEMIPSSFRRTRAGYWQRSYGAFSWAMSQKDSNVDIGSCSSLTDILKEPNKLTIYRGAYDEIIVENEEVV